MKNHQIYIVEKQTAPATVIRKLMSSFACLLLICMFFCACFYIASRFNDEVSKRRRVMNDAVFSVQEYLFNHEALLMHFSRSVTKLRVRAELSLIQRPSSLIGEDSHGLSLGVAHSHWVLRLSRKDFDELEERKLRLIHIANDESLTATYVNEKGWSPTNIPRDVVKGLFKNQSEAKFRWFSDNADPTSHIYIFKRIYGDDDAGWLGFEFDRSELINSISAKKAGSYLLLDEMNRPVMSNEPDTDFLPLILNNLKGDSFGFTGERLNPGYLALDKSIGGSKWSLIYYVRFSELVSALWWVIGASVGGCCVMAVLIWSLVRSIYRRLVLPADRRLQALIESESFGRAVIENSPVALRVVRVSDGKVVLENKLSSLWLDDLTALNSKFHVGLESLLEKRYENGVEIEAPNGRHLLLSAVPTRYHGDDVLFCAYSDISVRKLEERALAQAKQHADEANEAKSIFLATMSHEIRTPLYGLLGTLELLGRTKLQEQQQNYLQAMLQSSASLQHIINDILDISKIEAGELELVHESFDPCALAIEIVQMFAASARDKGVVLLTLCDPTLPMIMRGDVGRIRQILSNLLGNAVKFTETGKIVLRVRVINRDGERMVIEWQVTDTGNGIPASEQEFLFDAFYQARNRVGGTGLGLSICKKLTQLMNGDLTVVSEEGLGSSFNLALPIELVEQSDLLRHVQLERLPVYVKSSIAEVAINVCGWLNRWGAFAQLLKSPNTPLPVGAILIEFEFREERFVPIALPPGSLIRAVIDGPSSPNLTKDGWWVNQHNIHAIGKAVALAQGRVFDDSVDKENFFISLARRVLVVDDNVINQLVMKDQLEILGCEVVLAKDGHEAIMRWKTDVFDLVLTDVNMPSMGGYELTNRLRLMGCAIPIIGVTASAMPEEERRAVAVGMTKILFKPVDLHTLFNSLEGLIAEA